MDKKSFDNCKDITISIVTYNSADEINILLDSIKACSSFKKIDVFVIDNNSSDNTVEIIKKNYDWVKIIENKENLGFGKAHNLVIRNVNSKYHIIANPDIQIFEDTIEKAISFLKTDDNIAVVTPFVLNTDGTQQFLPKENPSLRYMLGGMFENHFKFCKKIRDEYTWKNKKITEPVEVSFCTGAFMICNTSLLQKVNGFDERYFLHFEDADLTRELKKVGKAMYNPDIKVVHKWHRENKKINKSFWVALKSMFKYMKKWR